jgi:tRNA wybutosine-synthesizing protein 2
MASRLKPIQEITDNLSNILPVDLSTFIPKKWEKIGDILILKIPDQLNQFSTELAKTYAEVLDCRTVLEDVSGITGEYRQPNSQVLYGDLNTETVHVENGVKYKLDASKIMFSSGNIKERIHMAKISNKNEVVVDLFAGIGYFSLPIALYSRPRRVYACEKNPIAYDYLCQNIVLNDITSIVNPLQGDNRQVAPKGIADRVIMGYLQDTHIFLPTAIQTLKEEGGIIHYHDACPDNFLPDRPIKHLNRIVETEHMTITDLQLRKIKSYAPGVSHVVVDVRIVG